LTPRQQRQVDAYECTDEAYEPRILEAHGHPAGQASGNHLEVTCTGYGPDIPLRPPQLGGLTY
jgi:hypothetical protein